MSGQPPSQPQKFRFWLPYQSNPALARRSASPVSPQTRPNSPLSPSSSPSLRQNAPENTSQWPSSSQVRNDFKKAESPMSPQPQLVSKPQSTPPKIAHDTSVSTPSSSSWNARTSPLSTTHRDIPFQPDPTTEPNNPQDPPDRLTQTTHRDIPIQPDPTTEPNNPQDPPDRLTQTCKKEEQTMIPNNAQHTTERTTPTKLDIDLNFGRPSPAAIEHQESSREENQVKQNASNGSKGTKIAISGFPRASLFGGGRARYRKEIEHGLNSLANDVPQSPGSEQAVSVITLAGHNIGASMVLPSKDQTPTSQSCSTPVMAANVNSNVQSINNSTMEASSCSAQHPGVHIDVASKQEKPVIVTKGRETPSDQKKGVDMTQQRIPTTPQPRVRRRCLRALMLESESDPENPQKPPRHGCRFRCPDKKEKDIEDHDAPASTSTAQEGVLHGGMGLIKNMIGSK